MIFLRNSTSSSGVTLTPTVSLNHAFQKVPYLSAKSAELFHSSPKRTKTELYLKTCDPYYKILTKSTARRLETFLPKIINSDQTGYIKGRLSGKTLD